MMRSIKADTMLQQILKDMYIDPELLAELPEDQKQYLLDKMREEQVRRWFVREKEEKEKGVTEERKPRGNGKKVDFMTGSDGNEWVWVMGEHPDDKSIEQILEEEAELKAIEQAEREIRKEMEEAKKEQERSKAAAEIISLQEKETEEKGEDTGGTEEKIDADEGRRETETEERKQNEENIEEENKESEEEKIEEEKKEEEEKWKEEEEKVATDSIEETTETENAKMPAANDDNEEKDAEKKKKELQEAEEEKRRKKEEERENKRKEKEEEKENRRKEKEEKKKAKEEEKENRRREKEEERESKRKKKEEEKADKKDNPEVASSEKEQKSSFEGVKLRKRPQVSEEEQLRKLIMRRSREILFDFKSVRARFEQLARTDAKEVKRHWIKQEEKARAVEAEIRQERQRVRAEQAKKPEPEALFNLQLLQAVPAGAPIDESASKPLKPPRPSPRGDLRGVAPSPPPVPPRPRVTRRPASRQAALLWFLRQQKPRGAGIDPSSRAPVPWFHGLISRAEAESRLEEEAEGSFLIRISERLFGYAVSVRDRFRCKHFLVEALETGYRLFGLGEHRVHATLTDFVDYHKRHPLTAIGQEKLLIPVAQTFDSATDEEAFYVEFFPERPSQDIASNL